MITYKNIPESLTVVSNEQEVDLEQLLENEKAHVDHDCLFIEHDCEKMLTALGFITLIEKRDNEIHKLRNIIDGLTKQLLQINKEHNAKQNNS